MEEHLVQSISAGSMKMESYRVIDPATQAVSHFKFYATTGGGGRVSMGEEAAKLFATLVAMTLATEEPAAHDSRRAGIEEAAQYVRKRADELLAMEHPTPKMMGRIFNDIADGILKLLDEPSGG